jgi:outer membrane immunogenic protein
LKTFPQQNLASTSGLADAGYISTQNAQQNFNVGWTAGGGAEWMMAPNWSIKGEALYYDLGNTSVSNVTYLGGNAGRNPVGGSTTRAYYQGVIARAGVNYHFNLGSMPATLASSALTADLPSIKSAPAAPAPLWTGFYAGLNAGYGFGTANNAQNYGWSNPSFFSSSAEQAAFAASYSYMGRNIAQGGFIGGGQVGYNYQHGQSIVLGFEADMQGSGISGEGNANGWAPYSQSSSRTDSFVTRMPIQAGISWMGTARGRFGYLITPSVIAYATGGLAYGGTYLKTFPQQNLASTSGLADAGYISTQNAQQNFNVGWTAGGGAEWMMAPNWSIKGEALYYDLGNTSVSNVTYLGGNAGPNVTPLVGNAGRNPVGGSTTRAYYQGVIARAGVNYHFNFANVAPVVAKF